VNVKADVHQMNTRKVMKYMHENFGASRFHEPLAALPGGVYTLMLEGVGRLI
jgi:hypothetical protein